MKRLTLLLALILCVPAYADCVLQAGTADSGFALGPFLDETDGITPETALTITSSEVILKKKDSTTFAAKNDATSCTHRSNGWYTCPLDATDTGTEGNLIVAVTESGAVPVWRECLVVGSDYYDVIDATTSMMTSRQAGNALETTVASVTNQTTLVLTAGASNNDAYNQATIEIVGGTEECNRTVFDYTGSTTTVTLDAACPFTVAATDAVRIHMGAAGYQQFDAKTTLEALNDISTTEVDTALSDVGLHLLMPFVGTADSGGTTTITDAALTQADDFWNDDYMAIVNFAAQPEARCVIDFTASTDTLQVYPAFTGTVGTEGYVLMAAPGCSVTGSKIKDDAISTEEVADGFITAAKIAPDAIGASEIAADAIGASEIATSAIGADEIAAGAIGASEIATDAIGAAEIAASAIGTSELATDAIGADELSAAAVDEIWNEVAEDQGTTYTAREVLSLLLSEAMGTCTYTQGTRTWVCKDPSGTETRFTLVYGSELDGDRSTSTPAPVTP